MPTLFSKPNCPDIYSYEYKISFKLLYSGVDILYLEPKSAAVTCSLSGSWYSSYDLEIHLYSENAKTDSVFSVLLNDGN